MKTIINRYAERAHGRPDMLCPKATEKGDEPNKHNFTIGSCVIRQLYCDGSSKDQRGGCYGTKCEAGLAILKREGLDRPELNERKKSKEEIDRAEVIRVRMHKRNAEAVNRRQVAKINACLKYLSLRQLAKLSDVPGLTIRNVQAGKASLDAIQSKSISKLKRQFCK
jgi:hypothetical protein